MAYLKELRHYSKKELLEKLDHNETILNKLLKNNFIKEEKEEYSFNYVGIIITGDTTIKVYPKYMPDTEREPEIKEHFKQVIRVIKKDKSTNKTKLEKEESRETTHNLLSLMLFFIEDYYENGVYTNIENTLETNGNGEIHWDKTINNTTPIISKQNPYYIQLQTKKKTNDNNNYFRQLHKYIITQSSKYMEKQELLELLGITPIELSDKTLEDFGEKTEILEKISKELNIVFNTQKRQVLKSMYSIISKDNPFNQEKHITSYGTNTFHTTWENICSNIFNDKKYKKLEKLKLPTPLKKKYNPQMELIDIIPKATWNIKEKTYQPNKTLIPDIITIYKNQFIIYDAKYYVYKTNKNRIENQPGIESITKQYLYELAYKEFITDHKFTKIQNGFLFPKYAGKIEIEGYTEYEILKNLNLENIQIILLPVKEIYEAYLKNKKIKIKNVTDHLR